MTTIKSIPGLALACTVAMAMATPALAKGGSSAGPEGRGSHIKELGKAVMQSDRGGSRGEEGGGRGRGRGHSSHGNGHGYGHSSHGNGHGYGHHEDDSESP